MKSRQLLAILAIAFLGCLTVFPVAVRAQVDTGIPKFGSFTSGPDVINLGNLNSHFEAPVFNKPGRGMPFIYSLSFDSSVWYPSGGTWTPVYNWGWRALTEAVTGQVTYAVSQTKCFDDPPGFYWGQRYVGFAYHDPFGTAHRASFTFTTCATDNHPHSGTAYDGSGYFINADTNTVTSPTGQVINPPVNIGSGNAMVMDRNGNQITVGSSSFTDTLGMTALSVSGVAPNPVNLTYTDTSGNARSVTVNYTTATVKTNFGCSGINEYGPTTAYLVSSIAYPDGSSYQFTYEPTPGYGGDVTGRIQSITLRTGATITYTYIGGPSSTGIECADGSTAGFTRATTDGTSTYSRSGSGTAWTTTVTDASTPGNQTVINFQSAAFGGTSTSRFYETHRTANQGASTALLQTDTCYNGATAPCSNTAITAQITEIKGYTTLNNNQQSLTDTFLSSSGFVTEVDDYDFGASSHGSLLRKTLTSYAALTNGMVGLPASVTVRDGNGNQVAQTTFGYDETSMVATQNVPQHVAFGGSHGNLTSVHRWLNTGGGSTLNASMTYDDTGNVLTATDPGGHTTSFSYLDSFSDLINRGSLAYVTLVSMPDTNSPNLAHHITKSQYDANTGLPVEAWDQNNNPTTLTYDLLLRPTQINAPDGGQTTIAYQSAIQTLVQSKIDGSRFTSHYTLMDGYGRLSRDAVANAESSPYDQQDFCYDSNGRLGFKSYTYQGSGWDLGKVCSGAGDSFAYDALGRTTKVTHSDGTYAQSSYTGRASQVTDEGNGTYNVSRITQSDGLGRLTGVCEVSAVTLLGGGGTPAACGLDITATGFLTAYAYDTLDNLTTATQGSLTARTYAYDSLSRLTSKTDPESGTTTYTYNSDSLLAQRVRPQANQTNPAVTTTTTYSYDPLHRLTGRSYSDSTGTPATFNYDESNVWGSALSNTIGRESSESAAFVSQQIIGYDSMGRVTFNAQCTPRTCGTTAYYFAYTYDLIGDMTSFTNGMGVTFSNSYNAAGRLTGMTSSLVDAQHPATLVSAVHYGPFGVTSATLGNGVTESYGYSSRGARQSYSSTPYAYTLGFAPNGSISSGNDSVNGNWTYGYDQFNRLASSSMNSGQQTFTYDYDRYGNRWHQNAPQGGPAPQYLFDNNNRITGSGIVYDAAGNITNDGVGNTYSYDAEGRLSSVNGGSVNYTYDAEGRRVRKDDEFLYDLSGHVIAWINTAPGTAGVWDLGEIYAGGRDLATYSFSTTNFFHADWLGTRRAMSGVNGAVSQSCTGLPFADGVSCTAGNFLTYNAFTDDIHDWEDNLEHTLFRQLSGTQGRWTTPDPDSGSMDFTDPQSLNRYSYVGNDPINFVDPLGLRMCETVPCGPNLGGLYYYLSTQGFGGFYYDGFLESMDDIQSALGGPFAGLVGSSPPCLNAGFMPGGPCIPATTLQGHLQDWLATLPWNNPCIMSPVSDGCVSGLQNGATWVRAGDPNGKNQDCLYQANLAAVDAAVPFHALRDSTLYNRYLDYKPWLVGDQTPLNAAARRTGGAMSNLGNASKWSGFLTETGKVLRETGRIVAFLSVADRRERAYQTCRNILEGTSGDWYYHTPDGKR